MAGIFESKLAELGVNLPDAPAPAANYVPFVQVGDLVHVSGQISNNADGFITGKLGDTMSAEEGAVAAKTCAIALLAQARAACGGDLDRVTRVVKLGAFVASADDFNGQPAIVNGASDLMVDAFGDAGRHARFAVGTNALPLDCLVEIDGVFEIE